MSPYAAPRTHTYEYNTRRAVSMNYILTIEQVGTSLSHQYRGKPSYKYTLEIADYCDEGGGVVLLEGDDYETWEEPTSDECAMHLLELIVYSWDGEDTNAYKKLTKEQQEDLKDWAGELAMRDEE